MFASLKFVFIFPSLISATVGDEKFGSSARYKEPKYCILPPYPDHGSYTVSNNPSARPGDSYSNVKMDVSCDIGYQNGNATRSIFCINGEWSTTMPTCVPNSGFCTLEEDLKIEYRCMWVLESPERSQECPSFVPSGSSARPICRSPAYFSLRELSEMHCKDGVWDYKPICKPACGLITNHRKLEGSSTNHVEFPWHAVIYVKSLESFLRICSGSLISTNKIICSECTAARCFSASEYGVRRPAKNYMVAVNKMYDDYNDPRDVNSQHSVVVDIKIPSSYLGHSKDGKDNIAIVVVETSFFFHLSVRPVCLDFDSNLDTTQLVEGNSGKAPLWNVDNNRAEIALVQNIYDFQYKKCEDYYDVLRIDYRQYLTNDKLCAALIDSGAIAYDLGSGLAFLESTSQRYYLRGVLSSVIPTKVDTVLNVFTSIFKHEHFIKQYCNTC